MANLPSKSLLRLARAAAKAHARANALNVRWVDAFEAEYGHNQISDALVEVIDYNTGNISCITAEFIAEHSASGGD